MNVLLRAALALLVSGALFPACNRVDAEAAAAEAAAAAQALRLAEFDTRRLVHEIDALLEVPQDSYPKGKEVSAAFDELLQAVRRLPPTLRTHEVARSMGYFSAHGYSLGRDPQEEDVARLREDWQVLRAKLLTRY